MSSICRAKAKAKQKRLLKGQSIKRKYQTEKLNIKERKQPEKAKREAELGPAGATGTYTILDVAGSSEEHKLEWTSEYVKSHFDAHSHR